MVDYEQVFNSHVAVLYDNVDLLVFDEIVYSLARFLPIFICHSLRVQQGLWPECIFLWGHDFLIAREPFRIKILEALQNLPFLMVVEWGVDQMTVYDYLHEPPEFLGSYHLALLLYQKAQDPFAKIFVYYAFVRIQVDVENLGKN